MHLKDIDNMHVSMNTQVPYIGTRIKLQMRRGRQQTAFIRTRLARETSRSISGSSNST
jgi:hypothetical protein